MKFRNKITGLVVNTDRDMDYPWENVDEPQRILSVCADCGFEAASPAGLAVHQRVHPDEEE